MKMKPKTADFVAAAPDAVTTAKQPTARTARCSFYWRQDVAEALDEAQLKLRKDHPEMGKQLLSRSALIEAAVMLALTDLDALARKVEELG